MKTIVKRKCSHSLITPPPFRSNGCLHHNSAKSTSEFCRHLLSSPLPVLLFNLFDIRRRFAGGAEKLVLPIVNTFKQSTKFYVGPSRSLRHDVYVCCRMMKVKLQWRRQNDMLLGCGKIVAGSPVLELTNQFSPRPVIPKFSLPTHKESRHKRSHNVNDWS